MEVEEVVAISDPGEVGRAEHNRGDRFVVFLSNIAAWLFPALMVAICAQVILRNAGMNQAWLDDLQWWMYGAAVLMGVGYAVTTDSHVRVDVLYDNYPASKQTRISLFAIGWLFLPFVMLAWDDDHVYLSGRVEFVAGHTNRMDTTRERRFDADHHDRERVTVFFDTDRDYMTGFHFTIDETGQTSERCWRAKNWNPEWFVAADADERVWRFEVAIPQEELLARQLKAGDLWGLRIRRICPGVVVQSLVSADSESRERDTQGFGLVKFIRNRK